MIDGAKETQLRKHKGRKREVRPLLVPGEQQQAAREDSQVDGETRGTGIGGAEEERTRLRLI
jgi:hypothetical protein